MKFKLGKIDFFISFLSLTIYFTAAFFDRSGLFPLYIAALFIHESGHLAALLFKKEKLRSVKIMTFGVELAYNKTSCTYLKNALICLGGPAFNIICFGIFYRINNVFALINLIFALYNLLPVGSVDGGMALENLLLSRISPDKVKIICGFVSVVFLIPFLTLLLFICIRELNITAAVLGIYLVWNLLKKYEIS